jgi:hypothetical protein
MKELMASIGWLLLHWGFLEADINKELATLDVDGAQEQKPRGHLALRNRLQRLVDLHEDNDLAHQRIQAFRKGGLNVSKARNAIAHGLASADALATEPFIVCDDGHNGKTCLTTTQLRNVATEIEDLRGQLRDIRAASRLAAKH